MHASRMQAKAGPSKAKTVNRRLCVRVQASKPVVMVNSCTGKMGKAVADAAVRAGLTLAPYTLCSESEAGQTVEVAGHQMQLIGPSTRDKVIEQVGRLQRHCLRLTNPLQYACTEAAWLDVCNLLIVLTILVNCAVAVRNCLSAGEAAASQPDHG
jgi:hypothetical protein